MTRQGAWVLLLLAVTGAQHALADGTVELPARATFDKLSIKTESGRWKSIDIPKVRKRKITLPPGEYKYALSLRSSIGTFYDEFTVTDGSYHYIHRAITPDNQKVFSWISTSSPRSAEFEHETQERFCQGVIGYGDKPDYMINACRILVEADNMYGLFGMAYLYDKGLGGISENKLKASDYYLRAYRLGYEDAGISYFFLNQDEQKGVDVLLELADKGNEFSVGIAGQILAQSKDSADLERSRGFAEKSLAFQDPVGFKTLAFLSFNRGPDDPSVLVEAAAWLNLYMVHKSESDYNVRRFKAAVEEGLLAEDFEAVSAKTIEYSDERINSDLYFVVDLSVLKRYEDREDLSLLIGNEFNIPVTTFDETYAIELMPSDKHYSVTVLSNGDYVDSATFLLTAGENSVSCVYRDKSLDQLRVGTAAESDTCPFTIEGATSMWDVMSQFE